MVYSLCRNQNRPSTPEGERARIRAADHLERLQMTNPDERRSRMRVSTHAGNIVPLNYGAALAAQIPQVQMPADWNAPRQFPLPVVAPMGNGVGMVGLGINVAAAAIPQVQLPLGWDAPLANPTGICFDKCSCYHTTSTATSWMECTFSQPYSCGSTCTTTPKKKGEGKREGIGTIAYHFRCPALNNLHRGHIAFRGRNADGNAQQHGGTAREELLQRMAEERRAAEAATARESMLQQLAEQERQR
jgi:hypothetical protein